MSTEATSRLPIHELLAKRTSPHVFDSRPVSKAFRRELVLFLLSQLAMCQRQAILPWKRGLRSTDPESRSKASSSPELGLKRGSQ
jgi:hypothetical protein